MPLTAKEFELAYHMVRLAGHTAADPHKYEMTENNIIYALCQFKESNFDVAWDHEEGSERSIAKLQITMHDHSDVARAQAAVSEAATQFQDALIRLQATIDKEKEPKK